MKTLRIVLLSAFLCLMCGAPRARAGEGIIFIVNNGNPVTALSTAEIADYFLKRNKHWPDGTSVRFIDRNTGSPERKLLLSGVLRQSPADIDLFWIGQKLRMGDSAPLQVLSDQTVLEFVAAFRGGIGYVSAATPLKGVDVKVVKVTDLPKE